MAARQRLLDLDGDERGRRQGEHDGELERVQRLGLEGVLQEEDVDHGELRGRLPPPPRRATGCVGNRGGRRTGAPTETATA